MAAKEAGAQTVVKAVASLPLLADPVAHRHDERPANSTPGGRQAQTGKAHNHAHAQGNPHVWLDPVYARDICRRLATAFIQADPAHQQDYDRNLNVYLDELKKLDQEISRRVAVLSIKEFVSFHPSFSYFAKRYGLKEAGVIEVAPGRDPTPGHIRDIVNAIRKYQVRVVFSEPQLSPRVAEVIATEAGVRVLMLDPLGGRPPYGDDYLRLMRYNLGVMERAMQ
jgi:zinc transport system substrate-binding protein